MATQLYVKLQTPTIELQVKAEDSSKTKAIVQVGFKRYEVDETGVKLDEFQSLLGKHVNLLRARQKSSLSTKEVETMEGLDDYEDINYDVSLDDVNFPPRNGIQHVPAWLLPEKIG